MTRESASLDESSDLWQTIPDSPVTTESNHTPIHNGLLFDGVRFWPGQQQLSSLRLPTALGMLEFTICPPLSISSILVSL